MSKERRSAHAAKRGTAPQPQVEDGAIRNELEALYRAKSSELRGLTIQDRALVLYVIASVRKPGMPAFTEGNRCGVILALEILFPEMCERVSGGDLPI